jgi:hypothetical protein
MDSRLVVTHNWEELTIDEAVMAQLDIKEGYIHSLTDITIKTAQLKDLLKDLNKVCELKEYDYSKNKNSLYYKVKGDTIKGYIRGNSVDLFCGFYTTTEEVSNEVWKVFLKYCEDKNDVDLFMHSYFMNGGQLDNSSAHMDPEELNYISEKYYPYIDTQIMFDQFFTGAENILLLVGEPGLGKSKMSTLALKHAYENPDKLPYDKLEINPALENQFVSIVYVKSTDVLVNDKFWRDMAKIQADICIIDDLDYMLTKRDSEVQSIDDARKNDFLNQFLSFTDGVEKTKTKFIITTNQKYNEIDAALLRKGRLFDILELRSLDPAEALAIWVDNGLKESEFYQVFHTHDILPADLGSEINKRLNTRIETATVSYLKEDGISKVEKASRIKKIGL